MAEKMAIDKIPISEEAKYFIDFVLTGMIDNPIKQANVFNPR